MASGKRSVTAGVAEGIGLPLTRREPASALAAHPNHTRSTDSTAPAAGHTDSEVGKR